MKKLTVGFALMMAIVLILSSCSSADPEGEYTIVKDRLTELKLQKPNSQEESEAIVKEATEILEAYVEKFPDFEKTQEFRYELKDIYSFMGEFDKGLAIIEEIIEHKTDEDSPEKLSAEKILFLEQMLKDNPTPEEEKNLVKEIDDFKKTYPESKYITFLDAIKRTMNLRVGNPIIEYKTKDTEGKDFSFEQYKGKVLLLDFWASWCKPCVNEMPNVIKTYEKYHGKGFDIIGVSLDQNLDKMNEFIKEQKMSWRQIADGKGWDAEFAQYYNIRSIPMTFLIDRKGIIRYTNVRGEELEKAVGELIEEK